VSGFYFFSYRPYGCPYCRSSPRERFVCYALDHGLLPAGVGKGTVLHVAPAERTLVARFRGMATRYVPADVDPARYRAARATYLDLTKLESTSSYDLIYASHVLEHVPDDRAAMRRMFEALRPGGHAMVLVPLRGESTVDGAPGLSASERRRTFGQSDHVRQYGSDIVHRLSRAGFRVRVVDSGNLDPATVRTFGFETRGYSGDPDTDRIFLCEKER
jgi:SAM-dependent methyltransferase